VGGGGAYRLVSRSSVKQTKVGTKLVTNLIEIASDRNQIIVTKENNTIYTKCLVHKVTGMGQYLHQIGFRSDNIYDSKYVL